MNLSNPDSRRALRSVIEAVVALCLVALLYWLTSLLSGNAGGLTGIARGCLIILGLNAIFYGSENTVRAIKLSSPIGSFELGDAPQAVATAAQDKVDEIESAKTE